MKRFYAFCMVLAACSGVHARSFHTLFEDIEKMMQDSWQEFDRALPATPSTTIHQDDTAVTITVTFDHLADDTVNAEFDSQRQEATVSIDGYRLTIAADSHTNSTMIRYQYEQQQESRHDEHYSHSMNATLHAQTLPVAVALQSADDIAITMNDNVVTISLAKKETSRGWPKQKINVIKSTSRS